MKTLRLGLILLFCCAVNACLSTRLLEDASEHSTLTVRNPDFQPRPGQSFAWYSPIIWSSDALPEDRAMSDYMTRLINEELQKKGYRIVEDQQQADYIIGAAIVDGPSERSRDIRRFFRLYPAIGESDNHFKDTTAMVGVTHRENLESVRENRDLREVLWRASLKAHVLGDRLAPEVQQLRLKNFAADLMRRFPDSGA